MKIYKNKLKYFLSLLCFYHFSCCSSSSTTSEKSIKALKTKTFLALGDSYTIGQSVDYSLNWPNQLVKALKEGQIIVSSPKIIAKTGWTTSNLLRSTTSITEKYDLVTLSIGVNNQYQGKPFNLFESEFKLLLDKAIEKCKLKQNLIIVSIPDYGYTPFGATNRKKISEELDKYNDHIKKTCLSLSITYVDITEISRELSNNNKALANDNLHPSSFQYKQWVKLIYPQAKKILSR